MMDDVWDIPPTWAWTEIKDVGEVISGGTPSTKEPSYWGDEVNWISPSDLTGYTDKTIAKGAKNLTQKGLKNSGARVMPAGSVHFSSRAPIGYIAISSQSLSTNQGFKSLVPCEGVFNEYIYYYLKAIKHIAVRRATGTTFKEISGTAFSHLPFALPPENEQKRIVAKIEELFSELDKGIENLKTAREQLRSYRQAVLKSVFQGKFTAQWRAKNPAEVFSENALVELVEKKQQGFYLQRLKLWDKDINKWQASKKTEKKPAKPSRPQNICALKSNKTDHLPALAEGWAWFRLADLAAEAILGKMLDKEKNKGELKPYLGNINVRWGKFDLSDLSKMRFEETETERYSLRKGDLVICEGGEPGRCAIWYGEDAEMRIQKALHRVRLPEGLINPEYLYYAIIFANELGFIKKHFTGTTIKHLTGEGLSNVEIPFCGSVEEQELVVKEIESQFSKASNLESEIDSALLKIEALRQSILKKAFSGQLVTQNPKDEPASVLLERIRSEKEYPAERKAKGKRSAA